jgi:hypothetical protein
MSFQKFSLLVGNRGRHGHHPIIQLLCFDSIFDGLLQISLPYFQVSQSSKVVDFLQIFSYKYIILEQLLIFLSYSLFTFFVEQCYGSLLVVKVPKVVGFSCITVTIQLWLWDLLRCLFELALEHLIAAAN